MHVHVVLQTRTVNLFSTSLIIKIDIPALQGYFSRMTALWRMREVGAKAFAELPRESLLGLLYGKSVARKSMRLRPEVVVLRPGFATEFGREITLISNKWNVASLSALSTSIRLDLQVTVPAVRSHKDTSLSIVPRYVYSPFWFEETSLRECG